MKQFWFVGLIVTASVAGCIDTPDPVGSSLLPPTDLPILKIDTMYASSHSVSRSPLNTLSSSRFMVGKYQSYEAAAMLVYVMPDSLQNVSVTDAKITLRANYHFGDSLGAISFQAFRAAKTWAGDSLTLDSLTQGGYYDPTPVGQVSASINDTEYVQFSLDTAMVRVWLAFDTTRFNYGLVLRATNTNVIKGFASFSSLNSDTTLPKLTVQYVKNGIPDTVDIKIGLARFVANISQTNLVQNPELIYVQAGVAYNGYLSFISIDPIPTKASIHNAVLELSLNQASSKFNSYTIDSLAVYLVDQFGTNFSVSAVSKDSVMAGQRVYQFQIQQFVQRWVRGSPAGLAIFTFAEIQVMDLFALYGENASQALKPRVIVTYSPTR